MIRLFPRLLLLLILLGTLPFAVTGCEDVFIRLTPAHEGMDDRLKPYLFDFLQQVTPEQKEIIGQYRMSMGFEDLPGSIAGVCVGFSPGHREIGIDNSTWEKATELERKALMFHEIAHCLCNRKHNHSKGKYNNDTDEEDKVERTAKNGYFEDGCATSMMHPRMQPDWCVYAHYDHYFAEIFEKCDP